MGHSSGNMDSVQAVLTGETLLGMQKQAEAVYTAPELIDYIVTLTEATRVHEYLLQGISPRGSIALLKWHALMPFTWIGIILYRRISMQSF